MHPYVGRLPRPGTDVASPPNQPSHTVVRMLGIPVKANIDSGGKANGIPELR
jgi:hypothetical protein